MSSPLNRALGLVFGQFIGDALGSRYEFNSAKVTTNKVKKDMDEETGHLPLLGEGPFSYGPGVVTDDGEMAMSLLGACLKTGDYDASTVATAYARWAQTNPPDIGCTCSQALSYRKKIDKDWLTKYSSEKKDEVREAVEENVRKNNKTSLSNGSLMRQSVLTALYAPKYFIASKEEKGEDVLLSAVESDTLLTHYNPIAIAASKAFALLLLNLIKGKTGEEALKSTLSTISDPVIVKLLNEARERQTPVILPEGQESNGDDCNIGYLGIALQVAVHQLLHCESFEKGLIAAVCVGGDTDTNGAIAGALLGARFGKDAMDKEWIESVEKAELRLQGENGIESFNQLIEGVKERYEGGY